jgi:FtsP/CotA-like multicopper oxidase with cupredoxin domain
MDHARAAEHRLPDPGPGSLTFYYTNQQSARLMFYHDHTDGITRLNVYAGEAAPYVLQDPVEQKLSTAAPSALPTVAAGTIPATQIPLVIQDKTFVPSIKQLANEGSHLEYRPPGAAPAVSGCRTSTCPTRTRPTARASTPWVAGTTTRGSTRRRCRRPSVRSPTRWPARPLEGEPFNPGTPTPSIVPESFMDTPLVNGVAYPFLKVGRQAYRFRILNASDDRTSTCSSTTPSPTPPCGTANGTLNNANAGEVPMVAAAVGHGPAGDLADRRPRRRRARSQGVGPSMIQIGNEGGFLPAPVVLKNTPVGYEYFRRTITVLNVTNHTLLLGPAERADVIVDFSQVPAGSKLILYNDAPAPMPGFDTRLDYYTGDPDQTSSGGAPDDRRLRPRHPHHHAVPGGQHARARRRPVQPGRPADGPCRPRTPRASPSRSCLRPPTTRPWHDVSQQLHARSRLVADLHAAGARLSRDLHP